MTRLNAIAESGFFPTPPHLLGPIAAQVEPSRYTGGALLDMFCGEGEAAACLGAAWRLSTVGVEIHEGRARAARMRLARAICSDAFAVIGTHDQFDACLHNPPYQYDPADRRWQRLEYKATLAVTPYVRPGGLLIAILPEHRVTGLAKFAPFLTIHYHVERVFRFPEPDYGAYRQVVIYARKVADPRPDAQAAADLIATLAGGAPPLPEACDAPLPLPNQPLGKRAYFRGRDLDREWMLAEVADFKWSGATSFASLVAPREADRAGRPAMPHKKSHLAQLIAAAVMNNAVLRQGNRTHVICGRTRKTLVETERPAERENDEPETVVREEFAVECRAFDPVTGEFLTFSQDDTRQLREYIQEWKQPLVDAVCVAFPPVYNFDFRETFPAWLVEYLEHQVARRAQIQGRSRAGLFEGQKHAASAVIAKLQEADTRGGERSFFILGAQMAFGKTMIAAAVTGAFTRKWALATDHLLTAPGWRPSFVVTEPTLLEQTAAEYLKADPLLRPRIVRNVRDVERFLDEARSAPWPMVMVLSRTGVKDGFGWRPAVVPRQRGYYREGDGQERRLLVETLCACPNCGVLQREAQPDLDPAMWPLARDLVYFASDRRQCHECGAPLWQDHRQIGGKGYAVEFWECAQHWDADRDRSYGADERTLWIDDVVCRTRRLEGARADFKLARGDRLRLIDERLIVQRAGRVVAIYDFAARQLRVANGAGLVPGSEMPAPTQRCTRFWRVPGDRRKNLSPPMARLPVAEYLLRLAKRGRVTAGPDGSTRRERVQFLVGVIDELQKYKAHDSNAGYALANLVAVADKTLALTGTLYNGYASALFHLEYRTNPTFRAAWPYRGVRNFVARYGLLEWIEKGERRGDDYTDGYSALSGYRRWRQRVRELPAISPELTALLLDHALFLGLQDLGYQMVERVERPVVITPDQDFSRAYQDFLDEALEALAAAREQGVHLSGAVLQAMLSYSAAPWRATEVRDHGTETVWAWAPDLEVVCRHCGRTMFKSRHCSHCHPAEIPAGCAAGCGAKQRRVFAKEQALLDGLLQAKAEGRASLVFVIHTDTRDLVTPRWVGLRGLCASVGLRAVSGDAWSAADRVKELDRAVLSGVDAVFINPRRVEVGLNLTQFPELHHYQLDYNLFTLMQASARSWRPTQTQPVCVHYYCTRDTYEYRALVSLARKMYAALTLYGEAADSALLEQAGAGDGDLLRQIIADVATTEVLDLRELFAEYNRAAAEVLRPGEFLAGRGIAVEERGECGDLIERQLESALALASPLGDPLQQMSLF